VHLWTGHPPIAMGPVAIVEAMKRLLVTTVAIAVSVALAAIVVKRLEPDAPTTPPGSWDLADEVDGA
jgi:hypothetical protein